MIIVRSPYEYGDGSPAVYYEWINELVAETQQFILGNQEEALVEASLQKWFKIMTKLWVHFKPTLINSEFADWLVEYFPLMISSNSAYVNAGSLIKIFEDILSEDQLVELIANSPNVMISLSDIKSDLVKSMIRLMK